MRCLMSSGSLLPHFLPLSSFAYFLLVPPHVGTIQHQSQCGFSFPLSLFLVSSSPGSTLSGITLPQSTAPCSAGSARPDALQISSWVPCTRFPDRPLPQPPATLNSLSPHPASEIASLDSQINYNIFVFFEKIQNFTHKLLVFLFVKDLGRPRHTFAFTQSNNTLRVYFWLYI